MAFFFVTSLGLVATVLLILGGWKAFEKAGEPGWAAIVPFYNYYVTLRIAGRPWWFLLLILIPIVNLIVHAVVTVEFARAYGKGTLFGFGLLLLPVVFLPIIGLGDCRYARPSA